MGFKEGLVGLGLMGFKVGLGLKGFKVGLVVRRVVLCVDVVVKYDVVSVAGFELGLGLRLYMFLSCQFLKIENGYF